MKITYGFHKSRERMFWARQSTGIWFMLWRFSLCCRLGPMMLEIHQGILTLKTACSHSQWSCLLLWLVKRNQVRLPERFGPLQPATAGLAVPSPWGTEENRLRLELDASASPKETTLISSDTLTFPGRGSKSAIVSHLARRVQWLYTHSSTPTCSWHTQPVKILRREFLSILVQPG